MLLNVEDVPVYFEPVGILYGPFLTAGGHLIAVRARYPVDDLILAEQVCLELMSWWWQVPRYCCDSIKVLPNKWVTFG